MSASAPPTGSEKTRRDAFESARGAPHLLHVFSTFVPAGPEMRAVRLIEAMGVEFRHSILAIDGRTDAAQELPENAPVRVLEPMPREGSLKTIRRLRKLLRRERPAALLTYNWGAFDAVLAARSLGVRAILHHEDGFNSDEVQQFKRRRVWTRRLALPGVHRVYVPSFGLERIARDLWHLAPDRIERIPNGVQLERFAPRDGQPALRDRLGIPRGAVVLGAMGHLRPVKNTARLLDALAQTSASLALHLILIGDGEERAMLETRTHELGLSERVHFVGHQSDPVPYLRALDIFCLTSDSEQMPVALLEAMACRLPVVATAVGDVAHILPEGAGAQLVDPTGQNPAAELAHGIEQLALSQEKRELLGGACHRRVESEFSFSGMVAAHRALWSSTVAAV